MADKMFDSIPTRQSLLNRLKDWADQTSWQEFFDSYWQLIYNVAAKAGLTDAEAQEVVQETVIAVAKKISEFKTDPAHGSFSAWLMQMTRWRIADQFRNRAKVGQAFRRSSDAGERSAFASDESNSTSPTNRIPDPAGPQLARLWSEEWENNLIAVALEKVKRQISPKQYQIFDLHALQNLSAPDTARTLKVSVASVYMAKHRVARLLKREIKQVRERMA
jgi:RNA polymerase sigma-70 factor (ECF subfamily)